MAILTLMFGRDTLATYELDREAFVIGRASDCDVVIDNLNVSRHHAKIQKRDGLYFLEDLRSNNGTYLNGRRIETEALTFGDEVGIGKHTLRFESHSRLGRGEEPGNGLAGGHAIGSLEDGGTVVVNQAQLEAMQQRGSMARRAHLRIGGIPTPKPVVELSDGETRIGRDAACEIQVPGLFVGRTHCIISRRASGFYLEHVSGLRGTRVNGARVREQPLADGDVIQIAEAELTFFDTASD